MVPQDYLRIKLPLMPECATCVLSFNGAAGLPADQTGLPLWNTGSHLPFNGAAGLPADQTDCKLTYDA